MQLLQEQSRPADRPRQRRFRKLSQGMLADLLGVFVAARPLHIDTQLVPRCLQSLQQCLGGAFHHRVSHLRIAREQFAQISHAKSSGGYAIEGSRAELPFVRPGEPGPAQRFARSDLLDLHPPLARELVVETDAAVLDQVESIGAFRPDA